MSEEESCPELQGEAENKERAAERPVVLFQESKLERGFRALCINGAVLALGLSLSLIGTALPDLQDRTRTRTDEITKVFVGRGMGFLVGSISSNYLLSQANQACWITFALVILAVTMATIPSCVSLPFLMGTLFVQGTACGIIKTGCGFIRRQHFARVDVAWARMLFISFAVGALLAPALLLPFVGSTTGGLPAVKSLQHDEVVLTPSSTALPPLLPARRGLIAPNVLSRLHRKRRSSSDVPSENAAPQSLENNTENGTIEVSTAFPLEVTTKDNVDNSTAAFENTTLEFVQESGNLTMDLRVEPDSTDDTTTSSHLTDVGTNMTYAKNSNETGNIGPGPIIQFSDDNSNKSLNQSDSNRTSTDSFLIVNSSSESTTLSALATIPVATVLGPSTPKPPKKPIANGEMLSADGKVADSSKFRDQIRQNLKKDVPDVDVPKSVPSVLPTVSGTPVNQSVSWTGSSLSPIPLSANTSSDLQAEQNLTRITLRSTSVGSSFDSQSSMVQSLNLSTFSTSTVFPVPTLSPDSVSVPDSPSSIVPKLPEPSSTVASTFLSSSSTLSFSKSAVTDMVRETSTSGSTVDGQMDEIPKGTDFPVENPKYGLIWMTKYSYWFASFVIGFVATCFAFYWVLCPRVYQSGLSSYSNDVLGEPGRVANTCRFPALLTATTFHLLYSGLEVTFAILVSTYAMKDLGWNWSSGVLLSMVYWGSFLLCRTVIITFFRYLRQSLVMLGGLLLCIVVAGGAFISLKHGATLELYTSGPLVWVLIGVLGFGLSAILPGGVAEIEKFLPHHSRLFQVLGASLGEMMLPPVIGITMTLDDTVWLAYALLAVFVLFIVNAIAIRLFVIRLGEGRVPRGTRSLPPLERDDLEDVLTNTNDETELLAKSSHSLTGSPLNCSGSASQGGTPSAIQSLMKNISNVKKD